MVHEGLGVRCELPGGVGAPGRGGLADPPTVELEHPQTRV